MRQGKIARRRAEQLSMQSYSTRRAVSASLVGGWKREFRIDRMAGFVVPPVAHRCEHDEARAERHAGDQQHVPAASQQRMNVSPASRIPPLSRWTRHAARRKVRPMRRPVLIDTKCRLLQTQSAALREAAKEMRRNAKALRAEAAETQRAAREARDAAIRRQNRHRATKP